MKEVFIPNSLKERLSHVCPLNADGSYKSGGTPEELRFGEECERANCHASNPPEHKFTHRIGQWKLMSDDDYDSLVEAVGEDLLAWKSTDGKVAHFGARLEPLRKKIHGLPAKSK